MAPRAAVLRWPGGKKASGLVTCQPGTAPVFFAAGVDGPLEERRRNKPHLQSIRQPGPIEVEVATTSARSGRILVTPRLMEEVPGVDAATLSGLAKVAGGRDVGIDEDEEAALSNVMRSAVRQIAATCTDPDAVGRTLRALERPFVHFSYSSSGEDNRYTNTRGAFTPEGGMNLSRELQQLEQGEHLLVRIALERYAGAALADGHRLNITATRQSDDTVQLSIINSNGWPVVAMRAGFRRAPRIAKTLSIDRASEALELLRHGVLEPSNDYKNDWHRLHAGVPMYTWLRELEGLSSVEVTGLNMQPQKKPDCAIEVEFAWLASVLHRSDYKLVKAHMLNSLLHAAKDNDLPQDVVKFLSKRVTTSLSARAMETGR